MPHVPLKVMRGEKDEEDIRDLYHQRFQAPGTSTEEEAEKAAHEHVPTDKGEASDRYMGAYTGSIDSMNQSDNASDEGTEDVHSDHIDLNTTGYETMESFSCEAIELQTFADVHQPRNTESDAASIGNVSEEGMQRFLGEHTGSVHGASQSDTASHEARELQALAQVHLPSNARDGKPSHTHTSMQIFNP